MTTLTGSEKQIAWASVIRQKFVSWVTEQRQYVADDAEFYGVDDPAVAAMFAVVEQLESLFERDDAAFWIENREGLEIAFDIANPRTVTHYLKKFELQ